MEAQQGRHTCLVEGCLGVVGLQPVAVIGAEDCGTQFSSAILNLLQVHVICFAVPSWLHGGHRTAISL